MFGRLFILHGDDALLLIIILCFVLTVSAVAYLKQVRHCDLCDIKPEDAI